MKASEVYKILESQPHRKFRNVKSNGLQEIPLRSIMYLDRDGYIANEYNHTLCGLCVDSEYELIPEKVDFMTAIQAYAEGKTIKCAIVSDDGINYIPGNSNIINYFGTKLADILGNPITTKEILEGKWYIED